MCGRAFSSPFIPVMIGARDKGVVEPWLNPRTMIWLTRWPEWPKAILSRSSLKSHHRSR
jgi:hypothetical protein